MLNGTAFLLSNIKFTMSNNSSIKPNFFYHSSNYGDQKTSSIKSKSSNGKKSHIYVHQFPKLPKTSNNYLPKNWLEGSPIHQNNYKHHLSDYYDEKLKTLKKQFDGLSLGTKHTPLTSPYKFPNANKAIIPNKSSVKSNPIKPNRMFLFRPEHKAAIDKLEETYWTKWKPNKLFVKNSNPKMKGLNTENDQPKVLHHSDKTQQKERGDSSQELSLSEPEEEEIISIPPLLSCVSQQIQVPESVPDEIVENQNEEESESDNMQISIIKPTIIEKEATPFNTNIIIIEESRSEISVNLKHTDSFIILSAKKPNEEKQRFQQPKCIKLFKNVGYSSSTPINYIKGGTYPLKSCLKKEGSFTSKSMYLSPPSGGIKIVNNHKLNKASRLSK